MNIEIFNVEGMSCSACAGHVKRAIEGLDGVAKAEVSFETSKAVVDYDPARVSTGDLTAAVEEEGYILVPVGVVDMNNKHVH